MRKAKSKPSTGPSWTADEEGRAGTMTDDYKRHGVTASWLNAIQGLFAILTKRRLNRGVFRPLQELKDAIHRFPDDIFTWTNDPNTITTAVKRGTKCNELHRPRSRKR
jgi:hypothetical protein